MSTELELLRDMNNMLLALRDALCGGYKDSVMTCEMKDGSLQITDLDLMREEIAKGGGR